jgi:predicted O-linked N-acetylglucosamine transferase (SPINDLY family)
MSPNANPPASPRERFMRLQALFQTGSLDVAEREVSAALKTASKDPNLLHLAAQIAEARGETGRAIMLYRRSLKSHPGWMEAEYNLARTLAQDGAFDEALRLMESVTRQRPDLPPVWESLAKIRQRAKDIKGALEAWDQAIKRAPGNVAYRSTAALLRAQVCDWSHPIPPNEPLLPQAATVFTDDPARQRQAAERYAAQQFSRIVPLPSPPVWSHDRLRVGYLSADFQAHATAWLVAELFDLHDRSRFEITAYSTGFDDASPIRRRIQGAVEHFVDLSRTPARAAAEKIRTDEIDVLIDLKGHTRGARLEILAYRPARVQMHWMGYPGTLGCPFIPFFIGDAMALPPTLEPFRKDFTPARLLSNQRPATQGGDLFAAHGVRPPRSGRCFGQLQPDL